MRTISVLNFKGGVGKTSTATNVAHALAMRGVPVLVIDCCLQANTSSLLPQVEGPTLTAVLRGQAPLVAAIRQARENLWIVPADLQLDKAGNHIVAEGRRGYYRLRGEGNALTDFAFVLFDHAPTFSAVSEAGLLASEEMLVPVELAAFPVEGLLGMFTKLGDDLLDHTLTMVGVVPVKLNRGHKMHRDYLRDLNETFGAKVLRPIRTDTTVEHAQAYHQTVVEYDAKSKAARDFRIVAAAVAGLPLEPADEKATALEDEDVAAAAATSAPAAERTATA